jgi:hypothetical protein
MDADWFSKVSNETLGVYPGVSGIGEEEVVRWWLGGDGTGIGDDTADVRSGLSRKGEYEGEGDEEGRGARAVSGEEAGDEERELCFIADLRVMLGVERPLAIEAGSDFGLNMIVESTCCAFNLRSFLFLAMTPSESESPWQAIYSSQFNAYYFYNTTTHETTWDNPLLPSETPHTPPQQQTQADALQAAAIAAGIDPSLAHLDPNLLPSSSSGPSATGVPPAFTAKFNARTGQFTRPDGRDPTHLSEHARMTRMSEFYFDVKAWETELAQRGGSLMGTNGNDGEEGGRKRKRPTKKDLVGFKLSLLLFVLTIFFLAGTLQRTKEIEEDCQDGMAAHVGMAFVCVESLSSVLVYISIPVRRGAYEARRRFYIQVIQGSSRSEA